MPVDEKELRDILIRIVDNGCESPSEIDGSIFCYYCDAFLGVNIPHDEDCPFIQAQRVLSRD